MDDQQPINAWAHAEQRYQSGQEVRGVVTRVAQFGVFVQVEPGIEGIIYAFELGIGPSAIAGFTPGQEMQLYVRNIDASRKRLELSLSNDPTPGLLDDHMLPPEARRKTLSNAQVQPVPLLLPATPANPNHANHPGCPTCQRPIQATWKFCVYCGKSLQRRCSACGKLQPDLPDAHYCWECGQPV
ncbi:MAG TPA: S1 RNA-binding domain-containing protein [Ktedonobacteraceae bacterium]|jgi:transcriptional accessory protein Tex/SPT6